MTLPSTMAVALARDYNPATDYRYYEMMEEVLAGETMQAIRRVLASDAERGHRCTPDCDHVTGLVRQGLPQHVAEWVCGD